jgi:hypothetical protein
MIRARERAEEHLQKRDKVMDGYEFPGDHRVVQKLCAF